jgi:hypothetical protein
MITLERLQKAYESKNSFYTKIDGNTISILVLKYPYTNFQITIVSKSNSNHVKDFYGSLGPFDTFNLINELLSPINDK